MSTWDPDEPTTAQLADIEAVEAAITKAAKGRGWLADDELVTEWYVTAFTQKVSDKPGAGTHFVVAPLSQPLHHEIGLLRCALAYIERDRD